MAGSFVPIALFGPRTLLGQFAVIAPVLLIVTVLCLWSEGLIFVPGYSQHAYRDLVASVVMYLIFAAVLAVLAQVLKLSKLTDVPMPHRSVAGIVFRLSLCALAYTLYYLVFGAITYQFFTKGYFPQAEQRSDASVSGSGSFRLLAAC